MGDSCAKCPQAVINAAVGLIAGQTEANKRRFETLFEDSDLGRSLRAQVTKMIDSQSIEFAAHGIELGFRYDQGFLVDDGTEESESDPLGQVYTPTTKPGHRLPHAWIEHGDKVMSTHDFVGAGVAYALITDEAGGDWITGAKKLESIVDVTISIAQIGPQPHLRDFDDHWEKVKGIKKGGAVLVRPDNIVIWRSIRPSRREGSELVEAVETLLGNDAKGNGVLGNSAKCNGVSR